MLSSSFCLEGSDRCKAVDDGLTKGASTIALFKKLAAVDGTNKADDNDVKYLDATNMGSGSAVSVESPSLRPQYSVSITDTTSCGVVRSNGRSTDH